MTKIYASLIMKNEVANLERCLRNIASVVDGYCIQDNGSSDGSQELAKSVLEDIGKPYRVYSSKWYDFGTNRTMCLKETAHFARQHFRIDINSPITYQEYEDIKDDKVYFLVTDMDNILHGTFSADTLNDDGYYIESRRSGCIYMTQNLLKYDLLGYATWIYSRSIHEYASWVRRDLELTVGTLKDCYIEYGRNGARSRDPSTTYTDLMYLSNDRAVYGDHNGVDSRSDFYTAQSYRDMGEREASKHWYLIRARNTEGYIDERYVSYRAAANMTDRNTPEYLELLLEGFNLGRPRFEIAHDIVKYFRYRDLNLVAWSMVSSLSVIKPPPGQLFMDGDINAFKFYDEASIAAYYSGDYKSSLRLCDLALECDTMSDENRERIISNRAFSVDRV